MAGLLSIIGKLFGNKYDKDVKEIAPVIEQINIEYSKLSSLTNDELRAKTNDFKDQIKDLPSTFKGPNSNTLAIVGITSIIFIAF